MTIRFFSMGFALITASMLCSAVTLAQTPAAISYGSIAANDNSPLFAVNTGQYTPVYVAQNTPATISPFSPTQPSSTLPPLDPYAVAPQTSSILPSGTSGLGQSAPSNIYSGNFDRFFPETYEAIRRFRDGTSIEYLHLPKGSGTDAFGMDELDLRMQLAFPCRFVPNNGKTGFFYVAPGASLVWWNSEERRNGFGAFLDAGVQPKFNDMFSLNAWGRIGVFSDFKKVTSEALRFQGRLEGIANISPEMQVHAGVIYYGRARVKMLPTGGVVYTPDNDWVFKLIFPNPKVLRRLHTGQQADWWGYVHLDYAGGSWDIDPLGLTDYNDIRLGTGIQFATRNQINGYFEFGGSFDRELYSGGRRWASPPSVLFLKTGIIF
jgi:hypothetical protein